MIEQMIRVTWHDAHAVTETWTNQNEIDNDPCIVVTVGHLLKQVKSGHVLVAQSVIVGDDPAVDNVIAIPFGMIKRIEKLKATGLLPIESDQ